MKKSLPFLWSVQYWLQSEMFLSNSVDMMKNLQRARRAVKLNDNNRCKKRNFQQKKVLVSYFRSDPNIYPLHPLISPPSYTVELVNLWIFNLSKKLCNTNDEFSTRESPGFLFPHWCRYLPAQSTYLQYIEFPQLNTSHSATLTESSGERNSEILYHILCEF